MEHTEVPFCISTVTAIVVILLTIIYYFVKNRNILPGPSGVPYLGLYPFLNDENIHLKLDKCKKVYGDLFSFTYSGRLYINMGSAKAIRELYVNNSQCFTEKNKEFNVLNQLLKNGLLTLSGEAWKVLRKFFVQRFRDYGLNTVRDDMAGPVYDSVKTAIEDLKAAGENPVNIVDLLTQRCTVVMRRVIFGSSVTDEELGKISAAYSDVLEGLGGVNHLLIGPFARLMFTVSPRHKKILQRHDVLSGILYSITKKIKHSMTEEHCSCIIEDYYKERNERRRNNDPTWKHFTEETKIRGHRIPKGSITLMNFWSTNHDPDTYEDPHEFKPSRYLPEPGKPKPELPILFGLGKRSCSGELFVMTQTFLFLTSIIMNFKLTSSNYESKTVLDFSSAGNLELILKPRMETY